MKDLRRRDGFEGQKMISLPEPVWKNAIKANPFLNQLYVTHIGYFPRAAYHYRDRKEGCTDNILIYCLRGKGWYSINGLRFEVKANEFIIIPATTEPMEYGADEENPWTIYWVHFSGSDMDAFNQSFNIGLYDGARPISQNEKGLELWNEMYNMIHNGYSNENLNSMNLCLYHFVSTFLYPANHQKQDKHGKGDITNMMIQYMRDNIAERLSVEDMAALTNLSPSHFSSRFRKAAGMSPMDFFIHLKLQRACLLLHNGSAKVKDIAESVGYDDPYHFSRLFKKHLGISPDQYRDMRQR